MKKAFLIFWGLILLGFSSLFAGDNIRISNAARTQQTVLSVLLSNEGGLIDQLIAAGHGGKYLYQVVQLLQPLSNGAIPQSFVDTLASRLGSQIFTQKLSQYAGETQTVGIDDTGEVKRWNIYANNLQWNSYAWKEGYQTLPGGRTGTATPLFTTTLGQSRSFEYYSETSRLYRAWAIVWNVPNAPTTFVLSNEGCLIDNLIAAGHGGKSLYQILQLLQPDSGGAIPQSFMDMLAACPLESDIFTAPLTNYSGINNPVCVNSNGTLTINDIFASVYSGQAGFRDIPGARSGSGNVQYTLALRPDRYIDAGSSAVTHYYAFGIAWAGDVVPTTVVLSNEGGLIDDLIAAGHGSKSLYQVLQLLQPMSGGAIPQAFMNTLATCPAGSDIITEPLSTFADAANNPICINNDGTAHVAPIYGKDHCGRSGTVNFQGELIGSAAPNFVMARGPASYIDAGSGSSEGQHYQAFTIIWSSVGFPTTFVLSNESPGYLIDNLIAAGHGEKSLYEVLQVLQPQSGGAIPQSFMDILAGCPAESEIFTVDLSNFAGLNNPVGVNSDGFLGILPVFGGDYMGETGYATASGTQIIGGSSPLYTSATGKEYYIDGGLRDSESGLRYNVFTIAWATAVTGTRTVTFVQGAGGTITGTKVQTVSSGGSTTAVTAVPNAGYRFVNWTGSGFTTSTANPLTVTNVTDNLTITANFAFKPTIGLSRTAYNFGSERNGTPTPAETIIISNTGGGTLNWTAVPSTNWIAVSPGSGTNAGVLTISISRTDLAVGQYTGTVAITAANATNSPQNIAIKFNVKKMGTDSPPFGNFATPLDGATIASSVPVTGWVIDDIAMNTVKIYRETGGSNRIYIGDAVFVHGARPDVERAYPTYPQNDRAGWGYMLLSNFLPNGGNGTFTLLAYATDSGGHEVLLGSKTITCDNANAVKPFGAIDTPTQGGTASGAAYVNFGWTLTPLPHSIATDGSTIWVYVDGVASGHPVYSNYRKDIATFFPGYANSDAAIGYYYLNTTGYADGVHTIAWSVTDSAGHGDGIGSRYFMIQNAGAGSSMEETETADSSKDLGIGSAAEILSIPEDTRAAVYVRRGIVAEASSEIVFPDADGSLRITFPEVTRVAVYLNEEDAAETEATMEVRGRRIMSEKKASSGNSRYEAYELVLGELRPLPIGTSFDSQNGVLYWQPGPGFLGDYDFVLVNRIQNTKKIITIRIEPK